MISGKAMIGLIISAMTIFVLVCIPFGIEYLDLIKRRQKRYENR